MSKRILVAVLDWGLGHATRCIPIIQELQQQNLEPIIGSAGSSMKLLQSTFPNYQHVPLPPYDIKYPYSSMPLNMAIQGPKLYRVFYAEHHAVQTIRSNYQVQAIISDNRYGCFSAHCPSFFMTHQLNIQSPFFQRPINYINHRLIRNFDTCWVPDYPGPNNLAGILSYPSPRKLSIQHIGPLSTFTHQNLTVDYDITVVLSGPEPQRTKLERLLINLLIQTPYRVAIVQGLPRNTQGVRQIEQLKIIPFLGRIALNQLLNQSKVVICRSGYSSVMDLEQLPMPAIFIPTPGQTEQIYLANKLSEQKRYLYLLQRQVTLSNLSQALNQLINHTFKTNTRTNNLLSVNIQRLKKLL